MTSLPSDGAAREADALRAPAARPLRYPDHLMPYVQATLETDASFADVREAFLLRYGYQTARAYRADLADLHEWAVERGLEVTLLSDEHLKRYAALLRRRKYSESTVRRRLTAWRGLMREAKIMSQPPDN